MNPSARHIWTRLPRMGLLPRLVWLSLGLALGLAILGGGGGARAQTTPSTLTPAAPSVPSPAVSGQSAGGGGPKNLVLVQNLGDGRLKLDGNVQLGRIPGPVAAPANVAQAYSSCTGCQTLAVALQVDLISADTRQATPENVAVAVNYACTDCDTVALAFQYVLTVDDPTQVPDRANQLMAQMRQELHGMQGDPTLTLSDAEARVAAVVAQFQDLVASLNQQQDETTEPTSPGATPPTSPVTPTTPG
jgi:putative peptide zinc metalloprotease protein